MEVQMDFIGDGKFQGPVASQFARDGVLSPDAMRPWLGDDGHTYITVNVGGKEIARPIQTNATVLRRDEWIQLDEVVLKISRERLGGVQDLISKGLTFDIGNGLGTTVLEYHDVSDDMEAIMTMDGVTRSPGDRPVFTANYLPLPIIHVDYEINARVLAASRNRGDALDTTSVEMAARRVEEKKEDMLFTSTSYTFGNGTIYGYLNEPNRNQVTLSQNWDASGKTGAEILEDVLAMKQAAIDAKHFGPYMIYIPTAYETVLDGDYDTTTPGTTIRERILKVANISGIVVIDRLTANNIVMVQMTSDVVRLVRGMATQNVQWSVEGNFVTKYKVMTIQVPQVRADQDGNSGVVHLAAGG